MSKWVFCLSFSYAAFEYGLTLTVTQKVFLTQTYAVVSSGVTE